MFNDTPRARMNKTRSLPPRVRLPSAARPLASEIGLALIQERIVNGDLDDDMTPSETTITDLFTSN